MKRIWIAFFGNNTSWGLFPGLFKDIRDSIGLRFRIFFKDLS